MDVISLDKQYVANTYARFPVQIVKGKGAICYDNNGKKYIDLGTGIGVNAFGFCDKTWVKAVKKQLGKIQHASNLYYTEPCAKLAELLCTKTGLKKVFFANSGAEANECAIKVARKYHEDKTGSKNGKIITLVNSFHGRTLATLSATGQDVFHSLFTPLVDGFIHVENGNIDQLKQVVNDNEISAIMLECVQGEGGVLPVNDDFITAVKTLCDEKDALLIIDEVQTGNGRTGKLYAYMHYGITPDIVTTAKGLGGGLPIGACIIGERAKDVLTPSTHGSTYGGNPIASAGAISVLERIDDTVLNEIVSKSNFIVNELTNAKGVISVTGKGLMLGIKTVKPAKDVVNECINKGVLCLTAKDKVRLLPPLNIPMNILKQAIATLKEVIAEGL